VDKHWKQIGGLWLIGTLAAAQLAKFAVAAPFLRDRFDLSLPLMGLLISLLEIGGAVFGFAVGLAVGRIGSRTLVLSGLMILALSGTIEAFPTGLGLLFIARATEGFGYLLVVIAAPTLIIATAPESDRTMALALWSTFIPVGTALGGVVTGMAIERWGVTGAMLIWPAFEIIVLIFALRLRDRPRSTGDGLPLPQIGAWLSALAFGIYTTFICALTMLLPSFLVEQTGASVGAASLGAGLAAIAALPGSFVAMVLIRRQRLDRLRAIVILLPTLLLSAALAPATFTAAAASAFLASTAITSVLVMFGGIASPIIYGRMPVLSGARSKDDPRIAAANGLLTQTGATGALIGPPLAGMVVGSFGWGSLGVAISALALAMLVIQLLAEGFTGQTLNIEACNDDRANLR
jgi:sugar phosphate permease